MRIARRPADRGDARECMRKLSEALEELGVKPGEEFAVEALDISDGGRSCALCGHPVDPDDIETYRMSSGWVRKRYGGGTNAVRLMQKQDKFAHGSCVDQEARGVAARQQAML